jgi:single-stranded DNA-binding protein
VTLLGGVGSRPNERMSVNGRPYATFSLLTNSEVIKRDGELLRQSEMHNILAFGYLGRYVLNNLDKG